MSEQFVEEFVVSKNGMFVPEPQQDEWAGVRQLSSPTRHRPPSQRSSARLRRTPHAPTPPSDDRGFRLPDDQVLITQVEDSDDEDDLDAPQFDVDEDEFDSMFSGATRDGQGKTSGDDADEDSGSVNSSLPPQFGADIDDPEAYDTDLELDEDELLSRDKEQFDRTHIQEYVQQCNSLGVIPVSYFRRHVTDRDFIMRHHGLGPLGAKAIAKPLEHNMEMESLNLEGNCIEAEGAGHLADTLRENVTITRMVLAENGLVSDGARAVCDMMTENTTITDLDMSGNGFKDSDGEHFRNMLENNRTLRTLIVNHNKFEYQAACAFRDAMAQNEALNHLDLSWNYFRLGAASVLAELIEENYGLKYLNLSMNGLGCDGAKALGRALATNQCLTELDVTRCRINDEGALALAHGVSNNDVLEKLRVGHNPLTPDGTLPLLAAFNKNHNSSLKYLDLTNIIVSKEFYELEEKLHSENRPIHVIHGGVIFLKKTTIGLEPHDPQAAYNRDPMTKLKKYVISHKLRLVDIFNRFDKDNSWTLSHQEFTDGIKSTGIDMSDEDIKVLLDRLDGDGSGEIDYKELVCGDRENRQKKRQVKKWTQDKEESEQERTNQLDDLGVVYTYKDGAQIREDKDKNRTLTLNL